jgi:hypothetical protein
VKFLQQWLPWSSSVQEILPTAVVVLETELIEDNRPLYGVLFWQKRDPVNV